MTAKKPMSEAFSSFTFATMRPWDDSEYIRVDGHQLVYTETAREGFRVRLPGGKWATVEQLRAEGHTVTMPRVLRVD